MATGPGQWGQPTRARNHSTSLLRWIGARSAPVSAMIKADPLLSEDRSLPFFDHDADPIAPIGPCHYLDDLIEVGDDR